MTKTHGPNCDCDDCARTMKAYRAGHLGPVPVSWFARKDFPPAKKAEDS